MGVVALVMAGGKATRMDTRSEKPLLKVSGKRMIERVIEALRGSQEVDEVLVAVSKSTPKTSVLLRELGVKIVETPGEGFCSDMGYVIKKNGLLSPVLVISADLPLVTKELIDEILAYYKRCQKPALMAAVPLESYERLGLESDYAFEAGGERLVPVGINVIDGGRINDSRMDEEVLILDRVEPVVNVNSLNDMKIAEKLLARRIG